MSPMIWIALVLVFALVAFAVATWLHVRYWTARFTTPVDYAREERVATPDGSAIELRRVPLPAGVTARGVPVLLVHGVAMNHRNLDFHPKLSLARALAAEGRDVWLVRLRSGRADLGMRERRGVRFGAMVEHDLPLAVRSVLAWTGASQLDYVGFSMGGMLLYAALGRTVPEALVRRAVIVGSPGRVRPPIPFMGAVRFVPARLTPNVQLRLASRLVAFAADWFGTPIHGVVYNRRNVARGSAARLLINALEDVPGPLAAEFSAWAYGDGVLRVGGAAVLDGLANVHVPARFFAGGMDRIAPPDAVRVGFDAWGRDAQVDKTFTVLSRESGALGDYGHGDLAFGEHLDEDLYAPVVSFLDAA